MEGQGGVEEAKVRFGAWFPCVYFGASEDSVIEGFSARKDARSYTKGDVFSNLGVV